MRNGQNPYRLDGVSAGTRPGTAYTEDVEPRYLEQTPVSEIQQEPYAPPQQQQEIYSPTPLQQQGNAYPQALEQQQQSQAAFVPVPIAQQQREIYPDPAQQQQQQDFASSSPPAQRVTNYAQTPVQPLPQQQQVTDHPQPPAQQQQPVFGQQSQEMPPPRNTALPRNVSTNYGEWLAPAAASVAGAGVGAAGYGAYKRHQREDDIPQQNEEDAEILEPATYQPSGQVADPVPSAVEPAVLSMPVDPEPTTRNFDEPSVPLPTQATANEPIAPPTSLPTATSVNEPLVEPSNLGGLEREGAHETGRIFPKILRHDTDISVSQLHVPGKFPRGA